MSKSWPYVKLGEVLRRSLETIEIEPESEYREVTVRLWGKGVVQRGLVPGSEIAGSRRFIARSGQLILSRIDARNGAIGLVPPTLDGAAVTNDFPVFDVNRSRIEATFLNWLSKTPHFVELCKRASEGTTNRVRLQETRFLNLEIPVPPLAEQQRIVASIEELAVKIAEARWLRGASRAEAEALIGSSVSALFPDSAIWKSVHDAVSKRKGAVRSGPFGSQLLHEEFVKSGVAAIGTRDVHVNHFELCGGWFVTQAKFETFSRYQVFPGDLLCTIVGASIGRFCVVPDSVPLAFTTKHVQALTLETNIVDPHFASYVLNFHQCCRDSLFSQVEGSAQPSLNAGKILATRFPIPPLPEQRHIVAYLDDLQSKVDALKKLQVQTAAELDAFLPSILDKAFKGEL